ncbi:MAG: hypothetical protein HC769_00740 [Cyanobacteria bacterium CRU_2_1]|nr:hypothetical protein [Cyanobacteria bacterium CRU_2_1]
MNIIPINEIRKAVLSKQWVPVAAIVLLATALRLYQLGTESLWTDEFHSLRATENFKFGFRVLYFALLRGWMLLSTDDAWLRGLSVVFGIGSVFLVYQLSYRLIGKSVGFIAAFTVAVSPLFIFHSQEVRMYMLSTFLTLFGTLAMVNVLERPTVLSLGWWVIARILAIYTTPLNLLLLLPDILLIFWKYRNRTRVLSGVAIGLFAVGLLFLPVAALFVSKSQQFLSRANKWPSFAEVVGQLPAATVYWPMKQLPESQFWFYGLCGLVLVFLLGFLIFNKKRSARLTWLTAWALIPTAILLGVSCVLGDIWTPRYLLLSTPYLIILFAAGFLQVWRWQKGVALVVLSVYAVALGGGLLHYYGEQNITDWRGLVQTIRADEATGDVIAVPSDFARDLVFDHYYAGSTPIYVVEPLKSFREVEPSVIEQGLNQFPNASRLWLVYERSTDDRGQEHQQRLQSVIDEQFSMADHSVFSGYSDTIDLFLLIPHSPARNAS